MQRSFLVCVNLVLVLLVLTACGSSKSGAGSLPPVSTPTPPVSIVLPIPDNRYVENYQVLLVGNSHVRSNDLGGVLQMLLEVGTGKPASAVIAPGADYLDERVNDSVTLSALQSEDWSHVIWQAQKYSTSGQYTYSTAAAEGWIVRTKQSGATPVLFPEHPRQGNIEEGMRVYLIHMGIAEKQASCVAPIGPTWDNAQVVMPEVQFYSDGNHASLHGTLLTALIFYEIISGNSADTLPFIPQIAIPEQHQNQLGQIASAMLQQFTACVY